MGSLIDLTGQRFGRWIVLKRVGNDKHGLVRWLCECNCESHTQGIVYSFQLRKGTSQSCGCLQKELTSQRRLRNIEGNAFGDLTVVKRVGTKKRLALWLCKCTCGREHKVRSDLLTRRVVTQCRMCARRQLSQTNSRGCGSVRRARKDAVIKHGLTQIEMARMIGCPLITLKRAESKGWSFFNPEYQTEFNKLFGGRTETAQAMKMNELSPAIVAEFDETLRPKETRRRMKSESQVIKEVLSGSS